MAVTWWERDPKRYESEIAELQRAGIRYERDEEAFADGRLRLRVFPIVDGAELPLVAAFPDFYPWFRFEVLAQTLNLPHHQHALSKAVCLIPRTTGSWRPGSDRLADFLVERLPLVIKSGSSNEIDAVAGVEEHQAEPYSDYYGYLDNTLVLVDSTWKIPDGLERGHLVIKCEESVWGHGPTPWFRGAVAKIKDGSGNTLVTANPLVTEHFSTSVPALWVRLPKPPRAGTPEAVFDEIASADTRPVPSSSGPTIRCAIFPEEHRWRGDANPLGIGWVFAVRRETGNKKQRRIQTFLARVGRFGSTDFRQRVPSIKDLDTTTAAIFGLGCIGAATAIELARAGIGELRVWDHDFVDPATVVRWPLGMVAAGLLKVKAVADFVAKHYPYTKVLGWNGRIGAVRDGGPSNADTLDETLAGANLLIDATAEYGVQYFLAEQARMRAMPYIGIDATQGAWGGRILRVLPGVTEGCWWCVQSARENGGVPEPPVDPAGLVQPEGCADPTFTGAAFDLGEISLAGVRTAVEILLPEAPGNPPREAAWNLAVLALRDERGIRTMPQWTTSRVRRNPKCTLCGPDKAK